MGSGFICVKIFSNNFFPVKQRGQYRREEAKVKTENVAATPEFTAAYKRPPFSTLFCPVRIQFRLHLAQMLLAGRLLCVQAVDLASRSGSRRSRFTGSLPVLSIFLSPLVKSDVLFV